MTGRGCNFNRYAKSYDINSNMFLNRALLNQSRSPLYDPYYSENLYSLDSALINYFHTSPGITHSSGDSYSTPVVSPQRCHTMLDDKYSKSAGYRSRVSSSPLASLENLDLSSRSMSPQLFSTPSKGDDDVLVMDGISSGSVSSGGSMRRTFDSNGSSSSPSSSAGSNFYNSEIRRSYKSGSQYTNGREELHRTVCMAYATNGYCQYGSNCKFSHSPAITPDSTPAKVLTAPPVTVNTTTPVLVHTAAPVPVHTAMPVPVHTAASVTVGKQDKEHHTFISSRTWTPEDDNIEVTLPYSTAIPAPREDVDRYIDTVLYGPPTGKRRLKVFTDFCPA